jgi:hypothetical protein
MARPGLEPGTPRFSVLRPNLSNWTKSPAIKRLLVGSLLEAVVSYLRTFALQLGTQIGLGTQSTPMAATSLVNAKRRVRLDGGVPAASCSAPVKHDVGGLSDAARVRVRVRARSDRIRRKGGASAHWHALPPFVRSRHVADRHSGNRSGREPASSFPRSAGVRIACRGLLLREQSRNGRLDSVLRFRRPLVGGGRQPSVEVVDDCFDRRA